MKKLQVIILLLSVLPVLAIADVRIFWTQPTTNVDGSPYDDPGGYNVYCGNSPGLYDQETTSTGASASDVYLAMDNTIDKYCVVRAFDLAGQESVDSNEVHIPIRGSTPPTVDPIDAIPGSPGITNWNYVD